MIINILGWLIIKTAYMACWLFIIGYIIMGRLVHVVNMWVKILQLALNTNLRHDYFKRLLYITSSTIVMVFQLKGFHNVYDQ